MDQQAKRKRSDKPPCEAEPQLKRAKAVCGANAYNMFCKIFINIGLCINEGYRDFFMGSGAKLYHYITGNKNEVIFFDYSLLKKHTDSVKEYLQTQTVKHGRELHKKNAFESTFFLEPHTGVRNRDISFKNEEMPSCNPQIRAF